MMLGDMGAEVIKVEEPGRGDDTRSWPPFQGGEATYFLSVNRGKKSLTVNLKVREGQDLLRRLARHSDVLLENFRPGTLDRLGLGYAKLAEENPRLVYCAVSGFGESGPEAGRPGYDLIVQGESGAMDLTGFADAPPCKAGISIADLVSGIMAAHGVVVALYARERTGTGQKVEVAMLDVMAALLTYQAGIFFATGVSPTRRGNRHPSIVPYEVFQAADAYLTVGVANNSLWERFCAALDHPGLTHDRLFATEALRVEHREALIPLLERIFQTRTADEWVGRLDAAGVPAGRIRTVGEVCTSPHLEARGRIIELQHPTAGRVKMVGPPLGLSGDPGGAQLPPPRLGEHTDEILATLLHYSKEEIIRLRSAGVV